MGGGGLATVCDHGSELQLHRREKRKRKTKRIAGKDKTKTE